MLAKNSWIGPAASAGLAVKTNTSLVPLLSAMILATSSKGPAFPSITLLNSEKSHCAPSASILPASLAKVAASILPVVPSGIVYSTLLFVRANVSSKSNTRIFLGDLDHLLLLALLIAFCWIFTLIEPSKRLALSVVLLAWL